MQLDDLGDNEMTLNHKNYFGLSIILLLILSLMLTSVSSVTTSISNNEFPISIKEGNSCYIDDDNAYISATPHTLNADGYVYLNVTSKKLEGKLDFCFGFNNKLAYPTSLELYDPKTEVLQHELDLGPYYDNPEYQVNLEINSTLKSGEAVNVGHVSIKQNITIVDEKNQTEGWEWIPIISQTFHTIDQNTKTIRWNTTKISEWTSIQNNNFDKESFDFQGMDTWYLGTTKIEKNKEYYLRIWLTVVPTIEDLTHEFFVGIKPNGDSIETAVNDSRFYFLDPWYNGAWLYRKSHIINSDASAGEKYPVRIKVYYNQSDDSGEKVFLNGKCQSDFEDIRFTDNDQETLLDYWMETMSIEEYAIFWVEVCDDLSSSSSEIYLYYGNDDAPRTDDQLGLDLFQIREYDKWSGYNPDTTFLKSTGSIIRVDSYVPGHTPMGYGFIFTHAKTSYLDGKRLQMLWRCYFSYSEARELGRVYIIDNAHLRTQTTNEFDDNDNTFHPVDDYTNIKPLVLSNTGLGWNSWTMSTSATLDLSSFSSEYVTILITGIDGWVSQTTMLDVDYMKILDSSNTTLKTYEFSESIVMEQTGTYQDYGLYRKYVEDFDPHGAWGNQEPQYWLVGWDNRKSHIITNATGASLGYQVKIRVDYGSGTDGGEIVYLNGKCRTDFGDIRFTDNDGETELDYWMETKSNGNYAVFWVEVEDWLGIDRTIYVYYGNSEATTTSDGGKTFVYFDDFSSDTSSSYVAEADKYYSSGGASIYWNSISEWMEITRSGSDGSTIFYVPNHSWHENYAYRVEITIDSSVIDEELTHFPLPLWISGSSGSNDDDVSFIFDEIGGAYQKIAVTESDGLTELFVEVEMWDSENEVALIWVSNSSWVISNTSDSTIYLYYDSGASSNPNVGVKGSAAAEAVWDSYYEAVYHLDEGINMPTAVDSSSNDNDLVSGNGPTGSGSMIDGCPDFEADNNDYVRSSSEPGFDTGTNDLTFEAWVNYESFYNYGFAAGQVDIPCGNWVTRQDWAIGAHATNAYWGAYDDDGDDLGLSLSVSNFSAGTWYYFYFRLDLSEKTLYGYYNDVLVGSDYNGNFDADPHLDQEEFQISSDYGSRDMDGLVDEVRVSYTLRSAAWMEACYEAGIDDLLDWGPEQSSGSEGDVFGSGYAIDIKTKYTGTSSYEWVGVGTRGSSKNFIAYASNDDSGANDRYIRILRTMSAGMNNVAADWTYGYNSSFHVVTMAMNGTDSYNMYIDYDLELNGTYTIEDGNICFACGYDSGSVGIFDELKVRRYTYPEPDNGDWGAEEDSPPSPDSIAFISWGTTYYPIEHFDSSELSLSKSISKQICDTVYDTQRFHYVKDFWGDNTEPNNVYNNVSYCETNYNYTAIFYKGHTWPNLTIGYCSQCNYKHYGIYENNTRTDSTAIIDYLIHEKISSGVHDFVFLWTCGIGANNKTGLVFPNNHSYGFLASWLDMNSTDLSDEAYNTPDNDTSDHCYISFENVSICFTNTTQYDSYNYGHFAYLFFDYALTGQFTVKDALDFAAEQTHGTSYGECPLNTTYNMKNPVYDPEHPEYGPPEFTCRMRVWGDGDHIIGKEQE